MADLRLVHENNCLKSIIYELKRFRKRFLSKVCEVTAPKHPFRIKETKKLEQDFPKETWDH